MITALLFSLLAQCQPGGICRPAAVQTPCIPTVSLPACQDSLKGREQCVRDSMDGGVLSCLAFCDGVAWRCIGSGGGGGGGIVYDGAAPITVTGTTIGCVAASGVVGGCVTTGAQTFAGNKTFSGTQTYEAQIDVQASSVVRGSWLYLDGAGGGLHQHLSSNGSFQFIGSRSLADVAAEFRIDGTRARTTGAFFSLFNSAADSLGSVDVRGVYTLAGPEGAEPFAQLVDGTGVAGHVTITTTPGQAVVIAGKFNAPDSPEWTATLTDGGRTVDGGYYEYAGRHGELTVTASYGRDAGMLLDLRNPQSGNGAITDLKMYVDVWGGMGQLGGQTLAQFAECPLNTVITTFGQYIYGQNPSTLMWARDKERWYMCTASGWIPVGSPGHISGFTPGGALVATGATTVLGQTRMYAPALWQRITVIPLLAGAGGGTYTVRVWDNTTSTQICITSPLNCNTTTFHSIDCAQGPTNMFDDVRIEADTSGCDALGSPMLNVTAEYF